MAPYREDLVVCVACIFTWYGLADLCTAEGIPVVLGHALSMKAIQGDQTKNDKLDAQQIAVLLRGGMVPQAYVYPAAMRATRDLLRRRMPLMRKRAERLAHIHNTTSQYTLPEIGKKLAYKANQDGVADRLPAPAVQQNMAVDLALIDPYDRLLTDLELSIVKTATQDDAQTFYRLRSLLGRCTKSTLSIASRWCKRSSPLAVWFSTRRNLRANAMGPPARRLVMPTSRGLSLRRPCSCYGTTRRARSTSRA
jgi:hypothetical protein